MALPSVPRRILAERLGHGYEGEKFEWGAVCGSGRSNGLDRRFSECALTAGRAHPAEIPRHERPVRPCAPPWLHVPPSSVETSTRAACVPNGLSKLCGP